MNQLKNTSKIKLITWIVFGCFALLNLLIPLVNHYLFRTFTWDYGTYNFAFYDYAHFRVSPCPLYSIFVPYGISFIQDHVSITLILFAPFYWLLTPFTHTYTLLILQWAFVLYGAWATHRLIFYKFKNEWFALLALVYYFVLFGRFSMHHSDCNLAIIGASMLPVFFYYFETKNRTGMILSFLFLCLNREDMPLCLGFIGLYLAIAHRKDKQQLRLGILISIVSLLFFFFIFAFIIPALEDENKKFNLFDYSVLGANPIEAIRFLMVNPGKAISYLFYNHSNDPNNDWLKASFYIVYGLSGGIILFFRPLMFLCFLPIVAKKMYNDTTFRWGYETYYSIEIASLLPILVFSIIGNIKINKHKIFSACIVCIVCMGVTYYCINNSNNGGLSNIKYFFYKPEFYRSHLNSNLVHKLLNEIPDSAAISASDNMVAHLSQRKKIYHFPYIDDASIVCVDRQSNTYPVMPDKFNEELNKLILDPSWKLEAVSGTFYLLKRVR